MWEREGYEGLIPEECAVKFLLLNSFRGGRGVLPWFSSWVECNRCATHFAVA